MADLVDQNDLAGRELVDRFLHCRNVDVPSWVYLIKGSTEAIKIGKAGSYVGIRRQLTSAQTYSEGGIVAIKIVHGGQVMEQELHRRFFDERLVFSGPNITGECEFRSEWFRGPRVTAYMEALSLSGECEHCRNAQLPLF